MAKGKGSQRRVPSTPGDAQDSSAAGPAPDAPTEVPESEPELTPSGFMPLADTVPPKPREVAVARGTGCLGGHVADAADDGVLLGAVPSSRTTWMGLAILGWCLVGLMFMSPGWLLPALALMLVWWSFSLGVMRREGHRGRCLRIRAWRRAWGGLVPQGKDPARPAGDED